MTNSNMSLDGFDSAGMYRIPELHYRSSWRTIESTIEHSVANEARSVATHGSHL